MLYSEARSKIKSGDLLAWTHRGWGSWYDIQIQLVRFFTQSEYSHVGIAFVDGERVFVLESVSAGIRAKLLSEEIPFYWMPTKQKWTAAVKAKAFAELGESYSKWEGILSLFRKIKPGANHDWECAEYAMYILQALGVQIDCRCVPSDVVEWVQDHLDAEMYTITAE